MWLVAALVLFVAVDAVLVVAALTSTREAPSSTRYREPAQPAQPAQPSTSPTPTAPTAEVLPVRRSLAITGESTVWRAEGGSCVAGIPPLLQISTDAGTTWIGRDLVRYDVRQILALSVRDANFGTAAVKLGDGCELAGFRSFTGGEFWERADDVVADLTFMDPDDPRSVMIAGERMPSPCPDAVQAAVSGGRAVVLCADGVTFAWGDGAWVPAHPQTGALAIVVDAPSMSFALLGSDPACRIRLTAEQSAGQCATTVAAPGQVAAVGADEKSWVWVDDWFGAL